MTIKELIVELCRYNDNAEVVIQRDDCYLEIRDTESLTLIESDDYEPGDYVVFGTHKYDQEHDSIHAIVLYTSKLNPTKDVKVSKD